MLTITGIFLCNFLLQNSAILVRLNKLILLINELNDKNYNNIHRLQIITIFYDKSYDRN